MTELLLRLGDVLASCPGGNNNGFDHNFVVSGDRDLNIVCRYLSVRSVHSKLQWFFELKKLKILYSILVYIQGFLSVYWYLEYCTVGCTEIWSNWGEVCSR